MTETLDAWFEHDALTQLNRLYVAGLLMTRNPADAEELVLETYARAYRTYRFDADEDLLAWLLKIQISVWLESAPSTDHLRADFGSTRGHPALSR
jgi:RNA polymerase sigma-70 factor (ECF subfamily)